MMRTKYTPGPWLATIFLKPENNMLIETVGSRTICEVHRHLEERGEDAVVANARLITAAPDLLVACEASLEELKAVLELAPHLWNSAGKRSLMPIEQQLKAAINKATSIE